jgi:hypothetical protein
MTSVKPNSSSSTAPFYWVLLSVLSYQFFYSMGLSLQKHPLLHHILGLPARAVPPSLDRELWVEYALLGVLWGTLLAAGGRTLLRKRKKPLSKWVHFGVAPVLIVMILLGSLAIFFFPRRIDSNSVPVVNPDDSRVSVAYSRIGVFLHGMPALHAELIQPGLNRRIGLIPDPLDAMGDEKSVFEANPESYKRGFTHAEFTWSMDGKRLVATRRGWRVCGWDFDNNRQWRSNARSIVELKEADTRFEQFLLDPDFLWRQTDTFIRL